MTLEKTQNTRTEKSEISKYLISGISENSVSIEYVQIMDKLFALMQKDEKTNNAQIVQYIEKEIGHELKADIKTDIALFGSKKTNAVDSGLIKRIKEGRIWVYIKQ